MSTNALTIRLRIVCVNPPPSERGGRPVLFGLQDKQGALQSGQPRSDGALVYECDVKASRRDNGMPNFTGSYTHGTPDERFLYLSLGYVGDSGWARRSKIMLSGITWEIVEAARASNSAIEVTVEGVAAPRAKVVSGWAVTEG